MGGRDCKGRSPTCQGGYDAAAAHLQSTIPWYLPFVPKKWQTITSHGLAHALPLVQYIYDKQP